MIETGKDSDAAALPPRPDTETGEPFPPPGRGWRGYSGSDQAPEFDRDRETRLSHKPEPPPGRGKVLVWHKESKRGKLVLFVGSLALLAGGLSVIRLLNGNSPFDWLPIWQIWPFLVLVALLITGPVTYTVLSAGADWFQLQAVRFAVTRKRGFIKLYELREIEVTTGGVSLYMRLADDTHGIDLALNEWQYDRRMWDLVYNGIVHSAAKGATVNRNAAGLLELEQADSQANTSSTPGTRADTTTRQVTPSRHASSEATTAREIDVAQLNDVQVFRLMEDPNIRQVLKRHLQEGISAEQFRRDFPVVRESQLARPADPSWFAGGASTDHDEARADHSTGRESADS